MNSGLGFRPVKTKRAFEEVCDQIRSEIQAGRIAAGDKLPSERDLAEQLQVSRATVREAFRTLEIGGVLSLLKGVKGGAVVMRGDAKPITQTITDLLSLGGLSLADYTEARTSLQKEIIRLACERATPEDFAALEANIAATREKTTEAQIEDRTALTVEFYALLARATKNKAMELLMSAVTEPLAYYIRQIGVDRTWDVAESRTKVVNHIRARDVAAAVAEMSSHMERLHAYMLSRQPVAPA
ncbi:FadR/GntR family transcriptional regulator [Pararhodobacter zhoushanensis]|uniref:GntR family transcriptional regulator n=1 Tax=Pararhodobacter zhoushanensis TaxID=2479545 RepID=A0ABT3H5E0_9RHOB|nr:FCD domain-containing protein [Pararhodobacter zhoushanensis]MCW1934997.1 GntR family transcriptional regulator [Pararhodobacter zhoushanensis]